MPSEYSGSSAQGDAAALVDAKPPPLVALFLIKFDIKVGYVSDIISPAKTKRLQCQSQTHEMYKKPH
jgi:hypothetical protein